MPKRLSFVTLILILILIISLTVFLTGAAYGQEPLVNVKGKKIAQIGIVVRDAEKTAIQLGRLFGIGPWRLIDFKASDVILHDKAIGNVDFAVRGALANLGDLQFEILQPLYGPSTHMEFLKKYGQGIHHVSFGRVDDHDEMLAAMKKIGYGIEMQGNLGGASIFTYMSTQGDLGTIFEFAKSIPAVQSTLLPYGSYTPQGPTAVNMKEKKIVQIGIVVSDAEKVAKRYWEVFGIGPWTLIDFQATNIILLDRSMGNIPCVVKGALAKFGNIQFELLQPVSGPSTHMEFFINQGQGIHHISFGAVEDHDDTLAALKKAGYGIEMQGVLGGASTFTYMATQKHLGTIFEIAKRLPGVQSTLKPYGTYPPSK